MFGGGAEPVFNKQPEHSAFVLGKSKREGIPIRKSDTFLQFGFLSVID